MWSMDYSCAGSLVHNGAIRGRITPPSHPPADQWTRALKERDLLATLKDILNVQDENDDGRLRRRRRRKRRWMRIMRSRRTLFGFVWPVLWHIKVLKLRLFHSNFWESKNGLLFTIIMYQGVLYASPYSGGVDDGHKYPTDCGLKHFN